MHTNSTLGQDQSTAAQRASVSVIKNKKITLQVFYMIVGTTVWHSALGF